MEKGKAETERREGGKDEKGEKGRGSTQKLTKSSPQCRLPGRGRGLKEVYHTIWHLKTTGKAVTRGRSCVVVSS